MNKAIRDDPAKIAAWLEHVRDGDVATMGLFNTQTAEIDENGIDLSQLRYNRSLTPTERAIRMVKAARFFVSVRGAARAARRASS